MILVKNKRERNRFFKFAIVGAIGFVVDFLLLIYFDLDSVCSRNFQCNFIYCGGYQQFFI